MQKWTLVLLCLFIATVPWGKSYAENPPKYVLWDERPVEAYISRSSQDSLTSKQSRDFMKLVEFGLAFEATRLPAFEELLRTGLEVKYKIIKQGKYIVVTPDEKHYGFENHLERKFNMRFPKDMSIYEALVHFNAELNRQTADCVWFWVRSKYGDNDEIIPECIKAPLGEDMVFENMEARSILMRILEKLDAENVCQARMRYHFFKRHIEDRQIINVEIKVDYLENYESQNFKKFAFTIEEFEAAQSKALIDFPRLPPQDWLDSRKDKCPPIEQTPEHENNAPQK